MDFIHAYLLTLLIEALVLLSLLWRRYPAWMITRNALVASTLTLPFVWFLFPSLGFPYLLQVLISELFAVIAEAFLFLKLFKGLKPKDALLLSAAANMLSFSIGISLDHLNLLDASQMP
jgi:hypothetical protein